MVTLALTECPQHLSHWKNSEICAHCLIHSSTDVEVRFCLPPPAALVHGFGGIISVCSNSWTPWRLIPEGAVKCTFPFWQRNDLVCPATHQLTPDTQAILLKYPAKKTSEAGSPDTGLHKIATKQSLPKNGCYKKKFKKRGFAIHFRNSHYQVVTILLYFQKHRNSLLPLSLLLSAGSLGCFNEHPHLSFLTWYYRNILVCSFHTLHSKAFLSTGSCIPAISSCV